MTEEELLLQRIATICFNGEDDMDHMSFKKWSKMTIEELRTVVILLNDEMIHLLQTRDGTRGPCFLLDSLYNYITADPQAKNLLTNSPITSRQRENIIAAYHAIHPEKMGIEELTNAYEQETKREDEIWENVERIKARMRYICDTYKHTVASNDRRNLHTEHTLLLAQYKEQYRLYLQQGERARLAYRPLYERLTQQDQQRRQAVLDQDEQEQLQVPRDFPQERTCTTM